MTITTSEPSPLYIRLFGPLDVRVGGVSLARVRSRKEHWLLALLLFRHGREVEREWLAGTLWPESENSKALLRDTLSDLRRTLGPEAHRLCSPTSQTLRFELSEAECDLLSFDRLLAQGDTDALKKALDLYTGRLLEGCEEEWVFQERLIREQAFLDALETLGNRALEHREFAEAVGCLKRVVAADPFRETAQRGLMRALTAEGDYAASLQVYRELREWLRREMNTDPDPATTAIYQQIRNEASRPAPVPRPLPQAKAPERPPCYLPRPLTNFIGRESEINAIQLCLQTRRLVTLTGTGGVGKTRLAMQAAETLVEDFVDGVWFADLAPLRDPALVVPTLAALWNLSEEAVRPLQATLHGYLQPRRLLLVLDNCEHLLEGCARLTESLLQECPSLSILATSRHALGVPGEMAWSVPSLSLPEIPERPQPETLMQSEAVQLFAERASSVARTFTLTAENGQAVAQLCRRLDGIPLAIELAAARIKSLSPKQILERLEDLLRPLRGDSPTPPTRQQTLHTAIDWSYDLLSGKERLLLQRLSVFAGGCTLEAMETVCSDSVPFHVLSPLSQDQAPDEHTSAGIERREALDILTDLIDKSLVVVAEVEEQTRYRLQEIIRLYSQEKLREAGGEETILGRHLAYFLHLAEEAEPNLRGPEQKAWYARLEAEHDNFRTALAWVLHHHAAQGNRGAGEPPNRLLGPEDSATGEEGLRLAGALWRFWHARGYRSEGRKWLAETLAGGETASKAIRAKALHGAGTLALSQGDYALAQSYLEAGLTLRREIGDQQGAANALQNLAILARTRSEHVTAQNLLEESLTLRRQLDDRSGIADTLIWLGNVAYDRGDYASAQTYWEESVWRNRELDNLVNLADTLLNLGVLALEQGDHHLARGRYEQSLEISRELGVQSITAMCLNNLGNVLREQGDTAEARQLLTECLEITRALEDKSGTAHALIDLGLTDIAEGDQVGAHGHLKQGILLFMALENLPGVAAALEAFAELALAQGQAEPTACLLSAVETIRIMAQVSLPSSERDAYDRKIQAAREALTAEDFTIACAAGRAMKREQTVQYALDTTFGQIGHLAWNTETVYYAGRHSRERRALNLPDGTVTFLFTDIEESTRLWEQHREAMHSALARHDDIIRQIIQSHNGVVFKTAGDAFYAVFTTAAEGLAAALKAQLALLSEPWPDGIILRVRMALHTGVAELRDRDYFGPTLNRAARLLTMGHGGQTLVSAATQELTQDNLPAQAHLRDLGIITLRGFTRPERVFQLMHPDLSPDFSPR